jgi:2,4-dienoyl-CoA reductase-like NADH-dependent reductase (Old Yellow Enzyme family)
MNLFSPLTLRGCTLRNRIGVSPMCQYSSNDGLIDDWHLVHLGSRAVGGAALVLTEATAVEARGRISPQDAGIWNDEQAHAWARIARFIASQGAVPGMQLAHAGRKASTRRPWEPRELPPAVSLEEGGWFPVGPDEQPFSPTYPKPAEATLDDIAAIKEAFRAAAVRAIDAGFVWLELHAAHGYLLHSFMSPLSNQRKDDYGGPFENRIRLTVELAELLRRTMPDSAVLSVRISATDWTEGGWDIDDSVRLAAVLKESGVDLIDVSTGGNVPTARIPAAPLYQVPFAARIKHEAAIATAAVGLITTPQQADGIIAGGQADFVLLAREMLRNPYWPKDAARALKVENPPPPPVQYLRAWS